MHEVTVFEMVGKARIAIKLPAVLTHVPMHDRYTDHVFQSLQGTEDQRAMCPGTGVGYIQVVAALFGRKLGILIGRHPVAKS